jgi:hypothetical protein
LEVRSVKYVAVSITYTDGSTWWFFRMEQPEIKAAVQKHCREFNVQVVDIAEQEEDQIL